jgi:hypothetical protein
MIFLTLDTAILHHLAGGAYLEFHIISSCFAAVVSTNFVCLLGAAAHGAYGIFQNPFQHPQETY